jgi:hypothetical protein
VGEPGIGSRAAQRHLGLAERVEGAAQAPARGAAYFAFRPLLRQLTGTQPDADLSCTGRLALPPDLPPAPVRAPRDAVAPTVTALRDASWSEIRRRELVPGDIVRRAAGDRVPADARLSSRRATSTPNKAALKGESNAGPTTARLAPCGLFQLRVYLATAFRS